jgi:hypothetical protein
MKEVEHRVLLEMWVFKEIVVESQKLINVFILTEIFVNLFILVLIEVVVCTFGLN